MYGLNPAYTQRPARDAWCTSVVWPSVLLDVTSYDATGRATVVPTTAPDDGLVVWAIPYDGTAATPVSITSTTVSSIRSITTTSSTASSHSTAPSGTAFAFVGCYTDNSAAVRALHAARHDDRELRGLLSCLHFHGRRVRRRVLLRQLIQRRLGRCARDGLQHGL